jgi:hypothetical protein
MLRLGMAHDRADQKRPIHHVSEHILNPPDLFAAGD